MKYFLSAFKDCIKFDGRARRSEFWFFALFSYLIYLVIKLIDIAMHTVIFTDLYYLVMLLPAVALSVRRMHDTNKSWWYFLIPVYNLILALTPGDIGENKYGPDPKNDEIYGADDYEKPFDNDSAI